MDGRKNSYKGRRGASAAEFAVTFPLLLLICFGAADFGRLFFHGIAVTHAASAAASLGALSNADSGRFADMKSLAEADTDELSHTSSATAGAERYCDCPNAPASGPGDTENIVSCTTATCPDGYGLPRVYVRARVVQNFAPIVPFPGIPKNVAVNRSAFLRVQ